MTCGLFSDLKLVRKALILTESGQNRETGQAESLCTLFKVQKEK